MTLTPQEYLYLQQALLYVFMPIIMAIFGVCIIGSILAAVSNLILDVVGHLYRA